MSSREADYYKVLEVSSGASPAEIKKAFHRLAFLHHPDKNADDPQAAERFRNINEAYHVLADKEKRYLYDQQRDSFFGGHQHPMVRFIYADINKTTVKRNEEVELTYAFGSEGRFFKKPEIPGCYITSGPIVHHRMNTHEGILVRETLLSYTVCPLITGSISIPSATINYERGTYSSNSLQLVVEENSCYFKKDENAGKDPVKVFLNFQQVTSNTIYRKTIIHQRTVLIPRSAIAAWYHKVGGIMKMGMGICGAAWALVHGQNFILGFLAGSLLAGINCVLMYGIMGIKSEFYYSINYPAVKEYLAKGYSLGESPSDSKTGNKLWHLLKSSLS